MTLRTSDLQPVSARRRIRRIAIAVAGGSVLAVGLALVVVPVPGTSIVVIPLGFAILAREFLWARRALAWSRRTVQALSIAVRQALGRAPISVPVGAR
jgi:tellurite resistance protein TerC